MDKKHYYKTKHPCSGNVVSLDGDPVLGILVLEENTIVKSNHIITNAIGVIMAKTIGTKNEYVLLLEKSYLEKIEVDAETMDLLYE